MASQLRVDEIIASTGSSVAIGTAGGSVTLAGDFTVDTSKGLNVGTGATIFSPSSNVLTLGTNSAERVRIDSSGNLSLAADTDTHISHPASDTLALTTGGTERLRITSDGYARLTTSNARLEWTASSGSNPFIRSIGSGQQELEFNTGGNEAARFTTAGNLKFPSGQGIDFSATADGSGTTTSELLDDYEEGTFTPDVNNSGYASRWNSKAGRYRKVGSKVTVWINCDGGTQPRSGAGTGLLIISGLPFAINSSLNGNFVLGIIGYNKGGGGSGSADANVNYAGGVVRVRIGGSDQSDQIDYVSACFSYFV